THTAAGFHTIEMNADITSFKGAALFSDFQDVGRLAPESKPTDQPRRKGEPSESLRPQNSYRAYETSPAETVLG
ncbi:hypothetical protein Daesc_008205, partial [Daldinia eschscholtzii]